MAELVNTFSWSWSRHLTFEACRYKYWMHYYGSWGGWRVDAAPEVRRRYVEKKLHSRHSWVGVLLHDMLAEVLRELRSGRTPPPERVIAELGQRARRELADARTRRHLDRPGKVLGLQELYYAEGGGALSEALEASVARAESLAREAFEHPVLRRISVQAGRLREIEALVQIELEGVPVWVSLDALVEGADGRFTAVDWKTGHAHSDAHLAGQLGVYAAYVLQRYLGVAPRAADAQTTDRVLGLAAMLADRSHQTFPASPEIVGSTLDALASSASLMRARLRDPAANLANEADFERLPEGSAACSSCAMRGACGR